MEEESKFVNVVFRIKNNLFSVNSHLRLHLLSLDFLGLEVMRRFFRKENVAFLALSLKLLLILKVNKYKVHQFLSVCPCIHLSEYPFEHPSEDSTGLLFVCLSICHFVYLSVINPNDRLSFCPSVHFSICPSVHLSIFCLSDCLSVCL